MLPTRPASGFTWPSFVFVPQAQQARQTPSQQAQAAQQASEATQPILLCCVLETALCVLLLCASKADNEQLRDSHVYDSSDFDRQTIDDCLELAKQLVYFCFVLLLLGDQIFRTATDSSPACLRSARELSRGGQGARRPAQIRTGADSRRPKSQAARARPIHFRSTRGAWEQRKEAPSTGWSAAARRGA